MLLRPSPRRTETPVALPAGVNLPISAVGADGTTVLEDGSLVHIVACYPSNFDTFTEDDCVASFVNFRHLAAGIAPGQVIQLTVEGDIVRTETEMAFVDRETELMFGFRPSRVTPRDVPHLSAEQRARWGIYQIMLESLLRAAPNDGWTPHRRLYLTLRYHPDADGVDVDTSLRRFLPGIVPLSTRRFDSRVRTARASPLARRARVERTLEEHNAMVRRALRQVNGVLALLQREGTASRILDGEAVVRYFRARMNPSSQSFASLEDEAPPRDVLSRFDSPMEAHEADRAATRLREWVACAPLDFRRDLYHADIERDLVRTIYFAGQPSSTEPFWLNRLLRHDVPFTLTIFLHGLDRLAVQDKADREYHQAEREVERAATKGRRDAATARTRDDRAELVDKMANDPLEGLAHMSLYLSLRAPGTMPNQRQALADAVDAAQRTVQTATMGGRLDPGHRRQEKLWWSTLPLADNVAKHLVCVGMDHVADSIPLIGDSFGSPRGLPLFISGSGSVQTFDPFDRAHQNATMVITGMSGTGKTMFANRLVAWLVSLGARGVVFDRAKHYEFLASLIPGSKIIRLGIGGDDAINPWDVADPARVPASKIQYLLELHRVLLARELSNAEEGVLADEIRKTYSYCARERRPPREAELVQLLVDRAHVLRQLGRGDEQATRITEQLALDLREFAGDGSQAEVWDRLTTITENPRLLIVDYSQVAPKSLPAVIFKMMEWTRAYVQRIDRESRQVSHPAAFHGRCVVLLDESHAWTRVKETAHEVQTFARQSRHLGTVFMVLSQDSKDFAGDAEPVLTNSSHRVFFRQDPGMIAFLREHAGLPEDILVRMKQMRKVDGLYSEAYVVNGGRGSGFVRLIVAPHEHWAFTSDPIRDVPKRERALREHNGDPWAAIAALAHSEGVPVVEAGTTG